MVKVMRSIIRGPLAPYVAGFAAELLGQGYTQNSAALGGQGTTLEQFCQMVARLVDELGSQHVALGSDCTRNWGQDYGGWLRNGRWRPPHAEPVTWPEWPQWFGGPEDFPRLTDGLVATGLDEETIRGVLGENWLRLFDDVFTGRSAQ